MFILINNMMIIPPLSLSILINESRLRIASADLLTLIEKMLLYQHYFQQDRYCNTYPLPEADPLVQPHDSNESAEVNLIIDKTVKQNS